MSQSVEPTNEYADLEETLHGLHDDVMPSKESLQIILNNLDADLPEEQWLITRFVTSPKITLHDLFEDGKERITRLSFRTFFERINRKRRASETSQS